MTTPFHFKEPFPDPGRERFLTAIVMTDHLLTFAGFIDNSVAGKNDASHARRERERASWAIASRRRARR